MKLTSQQWLAAWLKKTVEPMPKEAKNPMTWRVIVRRLFAGYENEAQLARKKVMTASQFLTTVQGEYPDARLSGWRFVEGEWERELDGVRLVRSLGGERRLRSRSFQEKIGNGGIKQFPTD